MQKKRYLVIPDIHHKIQIAQRIIDSEKDNYDKIIFLGDFFDDFGDSYIDAIKTAKWVKERVLARDDTIVILSNHDVAYRFPNNGFLRCSGFAEDKSRVINEILSQEDWSKFRAFYVDHEINTLFSHAGLTKGLFEVMKDIHGDDGEGNRKKRGVNRYKLSDVERILAKEETIALKCAQDGGSRNFFECGQDRYGHHRFGGINWCDFRGLSPIKGINQIFGHTPCIKPAYMVQRADDGKIQAWVYDNSEHDAPKFEPFSKKSKYSSVCLDMDSHLRHYGILNDGIMTVYESPGI